MQRCRTIRAIHTIQTQHCRATAGSPQADKASLRTGLRGWGKQSRDPRAGLGRGEVCTAQPSS